ncbi:MAG: hypothetical protein ACOY71_14145 [Gemmatimonadota bacterium]
MVRSDVARGTAICALCGDAIRPDEPAVVTPDFVADDADPLWRFTDAAMHCPCFLVWDRRRAFIARFNRVARALTDADGSCPFMNGEGVIERAQASGARDGSRMADPA